MPQLSLYLDEVILRDVVTRAKLKKISVSKFVSSVLENYLMNKWPDDYQNTFGSIDDDTFVRHVESDWRLDTPRENI